MGNGHAFALPQIRVLQTKHMYLVCLNGKNCVQAKTFHSEMPAFEQIVVE